MGTSLEKAQQTYTFLQRRQNTNFLGNKQTAEDDPKHPIQYTIVRAPNLKNYRKYRLWIQNPIRQAQLYEWRNLTTKPIIKIYYVQVVSQHNQHQIEARVYTEDIICTLERLTNLNFQQALLFLIASINGFQAIFRVLGYVSIHPRNIGINSQNQCKVWINSNLSLNCPDENKIKNQDEIVHEIVRIIRIRCSQQFQCFFIKLSKHLDLVKKATFHELQNYIKDNSILKTNLSSSTRTTNFVTTQKDLTSSRRVVFQTHKASSEHLFSQNDFTNTLKTSQIQKSDLQQKNYFQREESCRMGRSNFSSVAKKKSPPKFLSKIEKKSPNLIKRKEKKQPSLLLSSGESSACSNFMDEIKQIRNTLNKDFSQAEKSSISCLLDNIPQTKKQKIQNRISFSHQFTINIINDSSKKNYTQKQNLPNDIIKESQISNSLSNRQTILGSIRCQSRKQLGGSILVERDFLKGGQQFNSQLFQKHMKCSEDHIRRKSGQYNNNFNEINRKSPEKTKKSVNFKDKENNFQEILFLTTETFGLGNSSKNKMIPTQDISKQQIKAKQDQIISANSWKRKINSLVGNCETENKLNYSMHYEAEDDEYNNTMKNAPKIRLQKLQKIGRSIKESLIPQN